MVFNGEKFEELKRKKKTRNNILELSKKPSRTTGPRNQELKIVLVISNM